MTETEVLNLRLPSEFKRKLKEEAAKERRSVANHLEATITAFWNRTHPGNRKRESTG